MVSKVLPIVIIAIFALGLILFVTRGDQFELPRGKTEPIGAGADAGAEVQSAPTEDAERGAPVGAEDVDSTAAKGVAGRGPSDREVLVTDGTKHSIPLNEILSGGPPKDGIPSIDEPKFLSISEADFLDDSDIGLGVVHKGEARFYPYQILVWHEIVNDTAAGDPLLVTYCPLCLTGIVFDRRIDGVEVEFGVSGRLWRSNLLMYNRAADPDNESLWSQVLGEAVLGAHTGTRLAIIPSDTVRYGDWRKTYPDTMVLSRDTGATRLYGSDPYGDYYTNNRVSFGATFDDERLHPKEFVLGIELDGQYKAYAASDLPVGTTEDTFAGETITIEKSDIGEVRMFAGEAKASLPHIGSFWFSWVEVHPDTALYGA